MHVVLEGWQAFRLGLAFASEHPIKLTSPEQISPEAVSRRSWLGRG